MADYTLLSCVESKIINPTFYYGRFILGNFTKGQSLTVANSLRRSLLSQLIGISFCFAEIQGASHEYQSLPGVQESVLDILLNLRKIILKSRLELFNTQLAYINVKGPGVVRARDLKLPHFICAVDPNQYIANLSFNGVLKIKLLINCGKTYLIQNPNSFEYRNQINILKRRSWFDVGYQMETPNLINFKKLQPVENSKLNKTPSFTAQKFLNNSDEKIGYFPIDSIFAPVLRVNYSIEAIESSTKIKNRLFSKEKIIMEIWTNGSIDPRQAIHRTTKSLIDLFLPLQTFNKTYDLKNKFFDQTDQKISKKNLKSTLESIHIKKSNLNNFKKTIQRIYSHSRLSNAKSIIEKSPKNKFKHFLLVWLKYYVKKNRYIFLKIVKAVLKPSKQKMAFNYGFVEQNKLIKNLNSFEYNKNLFNKSNSKKTVSLTSTDDFENSQANVLVKFNRAKPYLNPLNITKKTYLKRLKHFIEIQKNQSKRLLKKPTKKISKHKIKKQKIKKQKKLLLKQSFIYFKSLIFSVELNQLELSYELYSAFKKNNIHNIEQLIKLSKTQYKQIIELNKITNYNLTKIQHILKNYVISRLI